MLYFVKYQRKEYDMCSKCFFVTSCCLVALFFGEENCVCVSCRIHGALRMGDKPAPPAPPALSPPPPPAPCPWYTRLWSNL
jgi:hypothetical protein